MIKQLHLNDYILFQTLGNHEFDRGVGEAVSFMENLESPVILANVDDSNEPKFQGKYQKTIVIDRNGRKMGIIGVILSTVDVRIKTYLFSNS